MSFPLDEALCIIAEQVGRAGRVLFERRFSEAVSTASREICSGMDIVKEADDPRTVQTAIDRMCQACFQGLLKSFPGVHVVTEEGGKYSVPGTGYEHYTVVIDDWDGSTNGSKGLNLSAVSVGLDFQGKPSMGCWYDPYRDYKIFAMEDEERGIRCHLSMCGGVSPFLSPPEGAHTLSQARLVIHRGTKLHLVSDLHRHPLSTLGAKTLAVMNFESSVIPLMHVAMGMIDGFVVAGNRPWDLWAARAIFMALGIPFAFMEPFTYRVLTAEEIVPDPNKEYAFACANNFVLMEEIMAVLQSKE